MGQSKWEVVYSLRTMELQFDPRKAPLGKLTKEQITTSYRALEEVAGC